MRKKMSKEEAIKEFSSRIYTKESWNLRTIKQIGFAAGLESPIYVHRGTGDFTFINNECIDPYGGGAKREVANVYDFCKWLASKEYRKSVGID